jgi:acetyl esterase/lipase
MGESVAGSRLRCHLEIISSWHSGADPGTMVAFELGGISMRQWLPATLTLVTCTVTLLAATGPASAQTTTSGAASTPAWADPANWRSIKPVETDNIVYATVPHVANPSAEASRNPGTPNGIRPPVPNTGPAGTLDMHLDVYQVASGKPTPVVVQLHGGGWIRGDRPSSSNSFGPFFVAGMSVVAVQYRNAIDAPAPAAIQDVRCAMAWIKANAKKYNFDPNKVIPWGGSAGGHLALMAGYAPASFDPPGCTDQPKVAAIIDMYGASDVAESLTYNGSLDFTHQWIGLDLPVAADPAVPAGSSPAAAPVANEGNNPDGMPRARPQAPRWPDPTEAVLARAREVSPLTYIHPGLPPTFIINGDQDHTYNPTQSYKLKAALDAAHVPNQEDIVPGGGHGNFSPAENQKGTLLWMQFLHDNGVF